MLLRIEHNKRVVYVYERWTVMSALPYMKAHGLEPDEVRKVAAMDHVDMLDGVEPVTLDEAIEEALLSSGVPVEVEIGGRWESVRYPTDSELAKVFQILDGMQV